MKPAVYRPKTATTQAYSKAVSRQQTSVTTPPLSNDATELASFQRGRKRPRLMSSYLHEPDNTMNDQTATSGMYRSSGRKRTQAENSEDDENLDNTALEARPSSSAHRMQHPASLRREEPRSSLVAGSATPPGDESEFETFDPAQIYRHRQSRSTIHANDASLPSPRLSPITAAANLNRSHPPLFSDMQHARGSEFPNKTAELYQNHRSTSRSTSETDRAFSELGPNSQGSSLTDIPGMIDSFDQIPEQLKAYVMFQLLRRCEKTTLQLVNQAIAPALKCDFLGRLPIELGLQVIRHLDAQSLCRATQVSRKWRRLIDNDERTWYLRHQKDGYTFKPEELQRAVAEGWGWQAPYGPNGHEEDLSKFAADSPLRRLNAHSLESHTGNVADENSEASSPPRKRKAMERLAAKKLKKQLADKKAEKPLALLTTNAFDVVLSADPTLGPQTVGEAARMKIPNPPIGLESIRGHHFFKSMYERQHSIRYAWMDPRSKPRHLAFRSHQRHVVTCLRFDSERIITGSDDAVIDIYNTQTGASVRRLHGHDGGVWALCARGNMLVSGSTDRTVRIWNIRNGEDLHVFQGHTSTVRCLVVVEPHLVGYTADGRPLHMPRNPIIITGSRDSTCRVWRLPRHDEPKVRMRGLPQRETDNPYHIRVLQGHMHSVRAIAAFCDTLVSGSYDTTVRVWKISTGELIHKLQGHTQKVYSVVLDYERKRCMSGSMDNLVKVWSLETGSCLFNLEGHSSLVGLLDLKDDRLVSAAADSTLRVWDPQSGRCIHEMSAHTGAITCFAHDGDKVISGSDRTLKMWNTKTGECVRDLLTDLGGVWQVSFDARRCVAAVQRSDYTYIEVSLLCLSGTLCFSTNASQVLDFGAARDGMPESQRGRRIVVDNTGAEIEDDWTAEREVVEVLDAPAEP